MNRAVLAQPKGSVNCRFKVTEQGEVIFARYGNRSLALRHIESVAAATLMNSAPSGRRVNTEASVRFSDVAARLNEAAYERYLDLLHTDGFAPWFSTVTPLAEVGMLPIGSRPAKRGLEPNRLTTCAPSVGVLVVAGAHQPGCVVRPGRGVRTGG
ncbi:MAG: phosphoenolpyruvate carboxylase [Eggerthella lenta]